VSRHKKHAEHANHERWMVSYADFVTLLFAFFVVMFAASQVDKRKVGKIALAVQVAFQQLGIFDSSNTHMALSLSEPMPFSEVQMVENAVRTEALGRVVSETPGQPVSVTHNSTDDEIRRQLEKALAPEIRRQEVLIRATREGLVVSLREIGFFDSGSATLKPSAEPAIAKIAAILGPRRDNLRIEGHTDNVPIHNSVFKSNWELSTARATGLVDLFVTRYHLSPERLSAAGYAEYHPVASNATPQGRALNRRVDIVILSGNTPAGLAAAVPPPPPASTSHQPTR
jgi:chemotaxis protein MotB